MISVIVPVYNAEMYLDKCINSILQQSYCDIELILVDDGSTDLSFSICQKYQMLDNRVRVYRKKNEGVSSARNLGLRLAQGDYIGFVDADDVIHKDMYALLVKEIERGADISFCKHSTFEEEIPLDDTREIHRQILSKDELFAAFYSTYDIPYVSCCTKLLKKELLKDVRFEEVLSYGEDNLVAMQCFYRAKRIAFLDTPLYYYRNNDNSATNADWCMKKLDSIRAYFVGNQYWQKHYEHKYAGYCLTKGYKLLLATWATLPKSIYYDMAVDEIRNIYKGNYEYMRFNQYIRKIDKYIFILGFKNIKLVKIYVHIRNIRR